MYLVQLTLDSVEVQSTRNWLWESASVLTNTFYISLRGIILGCALQASSRIMWHTSRKVNTIHSCAYSLRNRQFTAYTARLTVDTWSRVKQFLLAMELSTPTTHIHTFEQKKILIQPDEPISNIDFC